MNELVLQVRSALAEHADAERATGQQRYMKSELPFRGLTTPMRRAVLADLFGGHRLPDEEQWQQTVLELWDGAEYREERYAAIQLARHRYYRGWARSPGALSLYDHLVRTGRWWDYVDEIAQHLVGDVLAEHRPHPTDRQVTARLFAWAHDDDLWIRRSAIICQNRFRGDTDRVLLVEAIETSLTDPDFFARKAIGWSLREYAKTDPGWVRRFVDDHPNLSPLSRREALKHF